MARAKGSTFEAKVARYRVSRIRLFQLILPVAVGTAAVARHSPTLLTAAVAFGVQAAGVALLLSARTRFGWQTLLFERGGISVGSTGVRIERYRISRWTFVRRSARFYESEQSFKLQASEGAEKDLEALLERQFGAATRLYPRGSFRARMIALAVAGSGLALVALAIVTDTVWPVGIGTVAFILGIAAFGAFSQRVA